MKILAKLIEYINVVAVNRIIKITKVLQIFDGAGRLCGFSKAENSVTRGADELHFV